ncbi:MAG: integration host factor subunit alpha [Deltaproteobacteria bacterium]|nr:integration host factor subunit alpha [Deltaproteobacteria bacterium]MBW2072573.1 integration host factor subunit alpha [Deltaproteobacteria bacterium]
MTLTKANIAEAIRKKLDHNRFQAAVLVDSIFEIMKETLESGEEVLISGFGKFSVRAKRERRGRNPQTGEQIMIAPRKVVTFKCASVLRDKLNGRR